MPKHTTHKKNITKASYASVAAAAASKKKKKTTAASTARTSKAIRSFAKSASSKEVSSITTPPTPRDHDRSGSSISDCIEAFDELSIHRIGDYSSLEDLSSSVRTAYTCQDDKTFAFSSLHSNCLHRLNCMQMRSFFSDDEITEIVIDSRGDFSKSQELMKGALAEKLAPTVFIKMIRLDVNDEPSKLEMDTARDIATILVNRLMRDECEDEDDDVKLLAQDCMSHYCNQFCVKN